MEDYLMYFFACTIFYCLHKLIVIHGKKAAYIFWTMSEIVLLFWIVKMLTIDRVYYIPSFFILQAVLIIFVNINIKKKERNAIYDLLKNTEFKIILLLGIDNLEVEEYKRIFAMLEKILNGKFNFNKTVYLFITYYDNSLIIRYIFNDIDDEEFYIEKKKDVLEHIEECEKIGKGACLINTCDIKNNKI